MEHEPALLSVKEVLELHTTEQLEEIRTNALNELSDREEVVHTINRILEDRAA